MILTKRRSVWLAVLLAVGLVAAGCGDDDSGATGSNGTTSGDTGGTSDGSDGNGGAGLSANLLGSGATFPEPLYLEWIGAFLDVEPDVSINYQGIGSGGGREQFIALQNDFAGTDAQYNDEALADAADARGCPAIHIPMVHGAVVVAYNIPGLDELTLDADTVAAIFLGEITSIDDPAIAALNDGVDLPDQALTVAHRADGSGTTSIFTKWLEDESDAWAAGPGSGSEIDWPTGVGGDGNQGVATNVQQNVGGIGYVELSYATESGIDFATIVNQSGNAVVASLDTTALATDGIEIPEDLRFDVLGVTGDGYPVVGTTWIVAWECGYQGDQGAALRAWLTWNLEEGTPIAEDLQYAPLADDLRAQSLAAIERIDASN